MSRLLTPPLEDLILQHPSPDVSHPYRSKHNSVTAATATASPTVTLLERTAERLSLGAQNGDLATEIKNLWDEEKRRDVRRESIRSPDVAAGKAGANDGAQAWDMNDEIRKIWADEKRRSDMSSQSMQYSLVASPSLERQQTRDETLRSVSSKGSIMGRERAEMDARLSRTTTGTRSVTSPLGRQDVTSPLSETFSGGEHDARMQSPDGILGSPLSPMVARLVGHQRDMQSLSSDDGDFDFSRRNRNRDTITMPKRLDLSGKEDQVTTSRSTSTASKNTLQKAGSIFKDFDGAYRSASNASTATSMHSEFADELERGLGLREALVSEATPTQHTREQTDASSGYGQQPRQSQQARYSQMPQSAEGMVYYPAPVPRILNLPKKLSKKPAAHTNATSSALPSQGNRTSVFFSDVHKSAMYDYGPLGAQQARTRTPESTPGSDRGSNNGSPERRSPGRMSPDKQRQSMMSVGGMSAVNAMGRKPLPPQLRASMYLDGNAHVPHQVEVKAQSAVLTLESLLDNSARAVSNAPAEANTRRDPYGRRAASENIGRKSPAKEERSKVNYLPLGNWNDNNKPSSLTDNKENQSYDDTDEPDQEPLAPWASTVLTSFDRFSIIEEAESEHDPDSIIAASPPSKQSAFTAAPNTLLAELVTRKAAQKSRNRTAVDAFPDGRMDATLLELDAQAEREREERVGRRTVLAWEEGAALGSPTRDVVAAAGEGGEDEDIPLALLPAVPPKSPKRKLMQMASGFPQVAGTSIGATSAPAPVYDPPRVSGQVQTRPIDYLAHSQTAEDEEPLSARRSRLFGSNAPITTVTRPEMNRRSVSSAAALLSSHQASSTSPGNDEDDVNETLAQRTQRLKELKKVRHDLAGSSDGIKRRNTIRAVVPSIVGLNARFVEGQADEKAETRKLAMEVPMLARTADVGDKDEQEGADIPPPPPPPPQSQAVQVDLESHPTAPPENETLAQRRTRLKREAEAQQQSLPLQAPPVSVIYAQPSIPTARTTLRPPPFAPTIRAVSSASIFTNGGGNNITPGNLSLFPQPSLGGLPTPGSGVGMDMGRKVEVGGLLAQNELQQQFRKKQMFWANANASSAGGAVSGMGKRTVSSGVGLTSAGVGHGVRERGRTENWVRKGV